VKRDLIRIDAIFESSNGIVKKGQSQWRSHGRRKQWAMAPPIGCIKTLKQHKNKLLLLYLLNIFLKYFGSTPLPPF